MLVAGFVAPYPELSMALEIARRFAADLRLYAA